MITGFNTDLVHNGETYHVQTQERGVNSFVLDTYLYKSGRILESFEVSYEHIKKDDDYIKNVRLLMGKQHNKMIKMLKEGRLPYTKKLVQKAQGFVDAKDYEQANRYIKEAFLMAPEDEQIIKLKETIGKHVKPAPKKKYKTIVGSKKKEAQEEKEAPAFEENAEDGDSTVLMESESEQENDKKDPSKIIEQGVKMIDEGDIKSAIKFLEEAYENDPDNYDVFELLQSARLQLQEKAKKEEIPCLFEFEGKKYFNVDRAIDDGLFLFGDLQYKAAKNVWQKALEFDPENQKIIGFIREADEAIKNDQESYLKEEDEETAPEAEKKETQGEEYNEVDSSETIMIDKKHIVDLFPPEQKPSKIESEKAVKTSENPEKEEVIEEEKPQKEEQLEPISETGEPAEGQIPQEPAAEETSEDIQSIEKEKPVMEMEEKTENIKQSEISEEPDRSEPEKIKADEAGGEEFSEEELNETIELDPGQLEMKSQGTAEMTYVVSPESSFRSEPEPDAAITAKDSEEEASAGDANKGDDTLFEVPADHLRNKDQRMSQHENAITPAGTELTGKESFVSDYDSGSPELAGKERTDISTDDTSSIIYDTEKLGKRVIDHTQEKLETMAEKSEIKDKAEEKEKPSKKDAEQIKKDKQPAGSRLKSAEKVEKRPEKKTEGKKPEPEPVFESAVPDIKEEELQEDSIPRKKKDPSAVPARQKAKKVRAESVPSTRKQSKVLLGAIIAVLVIFPVSLYFIVRASNISKMRMEAEEFYNNGNYSGAINTLDKLISKYPEDSELLELRAKSYFGNNDLENAKVDYMKLTEMHNDSNLDALISLAKIEASLKNTHNLVALIPKILKIENTPENLLMLSDLAVEVDQKLLALELLENAFKIEPNNWNILNKKTRLYYNIGDTDTAKAGFEKLHEIDKVNKDYPYYLARISYDNNDYRRALIYLNNIVDKEIDKENIDYRVLHLLGDVYKKMQVHSQAFQKYNEAKEILEKKAQKDKELLPELAKIYSKTGLIWLERAVEFNDRSGTTMQNAMKDFETSIELNPANPDCYANMGKAYEFMNDNEKAEFYYYEALRFDRNNPEHYIALSKLYNTKLKDIDRAHTILKDAYLEGIFDCNLLAELIDITRKINENEKDEAKRQENEKVISNYQIRSQVMGCP